MGNVRTHYFFREERRFPWEWYEGVPKIGETHSYLCSMLAGYSEYDHAYFLRAKPSYKELVRFSLTYGGLAKVIVNYCDQLYDRQACDRKDVAHEVMVFLSGFEPFRKDFQKRIDYLYAMGRVWIPEECRPPEEP